MDAVYGSECFKLHDVAKDTLPVPFPEFAPSIKIVDYWYELPADRIAQTPLADRDMSRMLVFSPKTAEIHHRSFSDLATFLPQDSCIVANNSRVVAARLILNKISGGKVEILLTQPITPSHDPAIALRSSGPSEWRCLIGGRNVNVGAVLKDESDILKATVLERIGVEGLVQLTWSDQKPLSEILSALGHVPLPPYIHRQDNRIDAERYQTIYAQNEGSVAAPTAGLHFTERTFNQLTLRGIDIETITLHVGLGTFKPVEAEDIRDHIMHAERFEFSQIFINKIITQFNKLAPFITCIGTTSLRALESIHWFGAGLIMNRGPVDRVEVGQWSAFDPSLRGITVVDSFTAVSNWMKARNVEHVSGYTSLLIAPGCSICTANALVTNFHQPGNTLLLLVAAFVGNDRWKTIYEAALSHPYRMLSYGDVSLLMK